MDLFTTWEKALYNSTTAIDDANNGDLVYALRKFKKSNKIFLKILLNPGSYIDFNYFRDINSDGFLNSLKELLQNVYILLAENFHHISKIYSDLEIEELSLKNIEVSENLFKKYRRYNNDEETLTAYLNFLYNSIVIFKQFGKQSEEIEFIKKYIKVLSEMLGAGFNLELETFKNAQAINNLIFDLILDHTFPIEDVIDALYEALLESKISYKMKEYLLWQNLALYILDILTLTNTDIIPKKEKELFKILDYLVTSFIRVEVINLGDEENDLDTILRILRELAKYDLDLEKQINIYNYNVDLIQAIEELGKDEYLLEVLENGAEILKSSPGIKTNYVLLGIYKKIIEEVVRFEGEGAALIYFEPILKIVDNLSVEEILNSYIEMDEKEAREQINFRKADTFLTLSIIKSELQHYEESKKFLKAAKKCFTQLEEDFNNIIYSNLSGLIEQQENFLYSFDLS